MNRRPSNSLSLTKSHKISLLPPPPPNSRAHAQAMAGEAGIPFYSANGAEFVEMFQGVAAARIRSLFESVSQST